MPWSIKKIFAGCLPNVCQIFVENVCRKGLYITKLMTVSIRAITEFYIENKCNIMGVLWCFFEEVSIKDISHLYIETKEWYCFYTVGVRLVYRENVIKCMKKYDNWAIIFDITYISSPYRK